MTRYDDSLRGYSFKIHQRDNFTCRYCGADGRKSFDTWLTLSSDHLLPKGHPDRNNPDFIVTACLFCNAADNRYFDQVEKRGLKLDNLTPTELIAQKTPYVLNTRKKYNDFWDQEVNRATE